MTFNAVLVASVFAVFASASASAQQSAETAEPNAATADVTPVQGEQNATPEKPEAPAATSAAASTDAAKSQAQNADLKGADNEALLRAQAAGYKLVTKDGKEVFCKKEMVTGSRLATRTRCLTLAQIEAERNATKDMLLDMSRKSLNIPEE